MFIEYQSEKFNIIDTIDFLFPFIIISGSIFSVADEIICILI